MFHIFIFKRQTIGCYVRALSKIIILLLENISHLKMSFSVLIESKIAAPHEMVRPRKYTEK